MISFIYKLGDNLSSKYFLIKDVLPKEVLDITYRYAIFDEIRNLGSKDFQVPTAYSKYGDPLTESILVNMQSIIENATGLRLYPTYSYYRIYRNGDLLKPHKDRPSCEISASICLGTNYDFDLSPWPLFIDGDPIIINPGDMAIYFGLESNHWRNKLEAPPGSVHVQSFLHYVNADGPHADLKYDGRKTLGQHHSNKSSID